MLRNPWLALELAARGDSVTMGRNTVPQAGPPLAATWWDNLWARDPNKVCDCKRCKAGSGEHGACAEGLYWNGTCTSLVVRGSVIYPQCNCTRNRSRDACPAMDEVPERLPRSE